jgi:D-alanyl-lipoteichoic acid acyltransferase DltB (MBOAT superfamily)
MESLKELILQHCLYDPQKPLLFTQAFFWVLFMLMLLGYSVLYKYNKLRNAYLFLFSLYFYYKCGGGYVWLLVFSIVITYLIGIGIYKSSNIWVRKMYVALSVLVSILLLSYYKYTYFFIDTWNSVFHTHFKVYDYLAVLTNQQLGTHFDISVIFLPIGISFFSFQALSYTIDLYRRKAKPVFNIIDFGFYKSFFPQLVAGPIVRAAEFIPQMYSGYSLSSREMGHALFLILNGLLKKMIISDYISINFVDRVFDNPLGYSGFENLMSVYGYALQIYCDFSGYTDIAIGIALLLGFHIPINFNSPYKAKNLTDFWRRWHISLSSWLRDYLYIPMGGNKKGKFRTHLNLLVTMLIGGLWHGAHLRFIIWGLLHGLGLILDKFWSAIFKSSRAITSNRSFLGQLFTFQFVCFAWIFFRAKDLQTVSEMLSQIFNHFGFQMVPSIISGYAKVFFIISIGFIIHWIPDWMKEKYRGWFIITPMYAKVLISVVAVLLIIQFKSSVIQPFIYFQF